MTGRPRLVIALVVASLLAVFLVYQGFVNSGTLLVMDHDSSATSFASTATAKGGLTPQAADLIQELLDRWPALDEHNRGTIARTLLARVEPQMPAEDLARLSSANLRERLLAKLGKQ